MHGLHARCFGWELRFSGSPAGGEWIVLPPQGLNRPKRHRVEHVLHVPDGLDMPPQTVLLIESEGEDF
jgi:hypothetical protein